MARLSVFVLLALLAPLGIAARPLRPRARTCRSSSRRTRLLGGRTGQLADPGDPRRSRTGRRRHHRGRSVRDASRWSAPGTRNGRNTVPKHPEFEIEIFSGADCKGAEVGSGTAEGLRGARHPVHRRRGLAKPLSPPDRSIPDSPTEPSGCSTALTYWEGNVACGPGIGAVPEGRAVPKRRGRRGARWWHQASGGSNRPAAIGSATPAGGRPQAPQIRTEPGRRANDLTPLIVGSAPGADTVAVYAAKLRRRTVAKGTPVELSAGFQVSVARQTSETTFSAAAIGAQHSGCSDPVTYTEDSTAPRTRVTMGPGMKTRKHDARSSASRT